MRVAIIGGAGRMGRWLIEHFLNQGHTITISDANEEEARRVAESKGVKLAADNIEASRDADLIVISTPIEVTPTVIREVMPEAKRGSTIMEISSLKSGVIQALKEASEAGVRALSIHPLFGPGVKRLAGERIALIPIKDGEAEAEEAGKLFPEAEIIIVGAEEHDRAMALTLAIPHILNIAFSSLVGEEDIRSLKRLGGTTFKLQLVLGEGVMAGDPHLYASIQMGNKYTVDSLDRLISRLEDMRRWIVHGDRESFIEFYRSVYSAISKDEDFQRAYERMYRALEAL